MTVPKQLTFATIGGEVVTRAQRGKHYIEPRGYYFHPGTGPAGETCGTCQHRTHVSDSDMQSAIKTILSVAARLIAPRHIWDTRSTMEREQCNGWCGEPATVVFNYNISQGRQRVPLCDNCARDWQKKYNATPAGLSLCIETAH